MCAAFSDGSLILRMADKRPCWTNRSRADLPKDERRRTALARERGSRKNAAAVQVRLWFVDAVPDCGADSAPVQQEVVFVVAQSTHEDTGVLGAETVVRSLAARRYAGTDVGNRGDLPGDPR